MQAHEQACAFLLGRLHAEVRRLRAIHFPGHDMGPRKWLNLIAGKLDTASLYLAQSQLPGTAPERAALLVSEAETLGDEAYVQLTFVAGADSTQIPHQVVAPFQRWVEALGIEQTIFFRAEHLPNYELEAVADIHDDLIRDATDSLRRAHADISWPVLRVSVPGHAMGLLPHFAVVAHELGHAIQERYAPDLTPFEKDIEVAVDAAKSRVQSAGGRFAVTEEILTEEIIQSWVNELKADAIAHYLVGPAVFFALCGFLELSGHGYGVAETHPPSDMRRHFLFEKLQDRSGQSGASFVSVFKEKTSVDLVEDITSPNIERCLPTEDLFQQLLAGDMDLVKAALCAELIPAFYKLAPTIYDAAERNLRELGSGLFYTPDQYAVDIDRHLESLCALIPPIEYREGASLRACNLSSILNVGWVALLTRVDHFPAAKGSVEPVTTASRLECLHELLLKAVELSEARRLWENPT